MTLNDLRRGIGTNYNTLTFVHNGIAAGVEPSAHDSVVTFLAWYGDKTKQYSSMDSLLFDKFFGGKSLANLIGKVAFEFS